MKNIRIFTNQWNNTFHAHGHSPCQKFLAFIACSEVTLSWAISYPPQARRLASTYYLHIFKDHPNNVGASEEVFKLLVMQSSPT